MPHAVSHRPHQRVLEPCGCADTHPVATVIAFSMSVDCWNGKALTSHCKRSVSSISPGPEIRFTVVGDGPASTRLHKLAEELGLSEIVEWVRWVRSQQGARLLSRRRRVLVSQLARFRGHGGSGGHGARATGGMHRPRRAGCHCQSILRARGVHRGQKPRTNRKRPRSRRCKRLPLHRRYTIRWRPVPAPERANSNSRVLSLPCIHLSLVRALLQPHEHTRLSRVPISRDPISPPIVSCESRQWAVTCCRGLMFCLLFSVILLPEFSRDGNATAGSLLYTKAVGSFRFIDLGIVVLVVSHVAALVCSRRKRSTSRERWCFRVWPSWRAS